MNEALDLPEEARAKIDAMKKVGEDQLYEWLGETLDAEAVRAYDGDLKAAATEFLNFMTEKLNYIEERRRKPEATFIPLKPLIEKGKKFIEENKKKLHQLICVKLDYCKWEKEILDDTKQIFSILLPAVGSALGLTIPAAALTILILMVKWGLRTFCECKKKDDN